MDRTAQAEEQHQPVDSLDAHALSAAPARRREDCARTTCRLAVRRGRWRRAESGRARGRTRRRASRLVGVDVQHAENRPPETIRKITLRIVKTSHCIHRGPARPIAPIRPMNIERRRRRSKEPSADASSSAARTRPSSNHCHDSIACGSTATSVFPGCIRRVGAGLLHREMTATDSRPTTTASIARVSFPGRGSRTTGRGHRRRAAHRGQRHRTRPHPAKALRIETFGARRYAVDGTRTATANQPDQPGGPEPNAA